MEWGGTTELPRSSRRVIFWKCFCARLSAPGVCSAEAGASDGHVTVPILSLARWVPQRFRTPSQPTPKSRPLSLIPRQHGIGLHRRVEGGKGTSFWICIGSSKAPDKLRVSHSCGTSPLHPSYASGLKDASCFRGLRLRQVTGVRRLLLRLAST